MATFGDPKRERAFEQAWRNVPEYRRWQRLLTASFGLIMIVTAIIRTYILYSAPAAQIAHAVDVSNIISLVMIVALVVVSGILIRPTRKIIETLTERMQPRPDSAR